MSAVRAPTTAGAVEPVVEPEYEDDGGLWGLATLSVILRWVEELITALSGFALTVAACIGVIDLASGGQLTADLPGADFLYAGSLAIGISGQLVGMASRMSRSWQQGSRWTALCFYAPLVAMLAWVEWLAGAVYGFERTFREPVTVSLAGLGVSQSQFIDIRSGVAVGLIVLSGMLRYQRHRRKSVAEIIAENERLKQIAASEADLRQARLGNTLGAFVGAGRAALTVAAGAGPQATTTAENSVSASVESSPPPARQETASGLMKAPGEYEPDDPTFAKYWLPADLELTTLLPLTRMAEALGVARSTLSTLWSEQQMEWQPAHAGQGVTTKNIAAWQVLALVEAGLLERPAQVELHDQARELSAV